MCGILGYLNKTTGKELFTKALNRMEHRGPDGFGIWQENNISLGHRRLAIIDTSEAASQPMQIHDRYVIVFNGEIYNYPDLKRELELKGIKFTTASDTEVLLQAYITWGADCLNKLNGMWALAIWDKQKQELFLSRDRIGKKPLFYAEVNGAFIFSSEMKGITAFMSSVEMNSDVVNGAIQNSFGYEGTEYCLIKGIKRFPAATYAYYSAEKGLRLQSYWNVLNERRNVPNRYEEQTELFRELFFDACKIRMRSDVTIGTALSGGLDSSAIICSMAHVAALKNKDIQKDWQHAFVAAFPGSSIDETEYAKSVVDHLGIPSKFINIDPLKELNDIYKQSYLFEELYYAPTIPFVQLYRSIKQNGVTVSIDGHGADELFAGYPFDMNAALPDTLPNLNKFKNVLSAINQASGLDEKHDYKNKLKFAALHKYPLLQKLSKHPKLLNKQKELDFLNSQLYGSAFQNILPTLLRNYDRYSMINGVEIRMPFLDYRIIEFAFSIPYSSKIRNGFSKTIVRDALKDLLPKKISERKNKIGFNSPMHTWMGGTMKEWLQDTINSADFNTATLINSKKVKESIEQILQKKNLSYAEGEKGFAQLMPYIWEKSLKLHHE